MDGDDKDVDLVIYTIPENEAAQGLCKMACALEGLEAKEIYHNIPRFAQRILRLGSHETIVLVVVSSDEELANMLTIRHLFWDVRLILILPDRRRDSISMGHRLHPRFLSFSDVDLSEVSAVLRKIILNSDRNEHGKRAGVTEEKEWRHLTGFNGE